MHLFKESRFLENLVRYTRQLDFLNNFGRTLKTSNTTPVAATLNSGGSFDSELKAQKPMLGRVTGTIESRVAMRVCSGVYFSIRMRMEWWSRE